MNEALFNSTSGRQKILLFVLKNNLPSLFFASYKLLFRINWISLKINLRHELLIVSKSQTKTFAHFPLEQSILSTLILFEHIWEYDLLFGKGPQVDLGDSLSTFQPLIPDVSDEHMFLSPFHLLTCGSLTYILHNNQWVAARDMTSTMQGPHRQGHSRKTHYSAVKRCCIKKNKKLSDMTFCHIWNYGR